MQRYFWKMSLKDEEVLLRSSVYVIFLDSYAPSTNFSKLLNKAL